MKIIIDIPEDKYKLVQMAASSGGRLLILSEEAIKREQVISGSSCQIWISDIGLSNATVAIIESDKVREKKNHLTKPTKKKEEQKDDYDFPMGPNGSDPFCGIRRYKG